MSLCYTAPLLRLVLIVGTECFIFAGGRSKAGLGNGGNVSVPAINQHLKRIFADNELEHKATIKKYLIVQTKGKRQVQREVNHYNLFKHSKSADRFMQPPYSDLWRSACRSTAGTGG